MGKAKEIAEGWANLVLKKEHVERVSQMRMNICNTCEHISTKHKTSRPDVHCVKCNCPLATKTRSLESACPIGKWSKIPRNNEKQKQEVRDKKSPIE